jgi:DNA-binding MarR family transcriptional regulator
MGMEATSLTRTLKSMEEKGAIIRKEKSDDGRGVLIYLTELGKEKKRFIKKHCFKIQCTMKNHITEEKITTFY